MKTWKCIVKIFIVLLLFMLPTVSSKAVFEERNIVNTQIWNHVPIKDTREASEIAYTRKEESKKQTTKFSYNQMGRNGKTATQIDVQQVETASIIHDYCNLQPKTFYSISAYVKVEDIHISEGGGARIVREGTPASSEILTNDTVSWKKISMVALSNPDGTMRIYFQLNNAVGKILWDQIEIKEVTKDTNFRLYSYQNEQGKQGRIVFYQNKVTGSGITEKEMQRWLSVLLQLRKQMTEITGIEIDDGNVDIIATNHYGAVAYVISGRTEIQWMEDCVELKSLHKEFQKRSRYSILFNARARAPTYGGSV